MDPESESTGQTTEGSSNTCRQQADQKPVDIDPDPAAVPDVGTSSVEAAAVPDVASSSVEAAAPQNTETIADQTGNSASGPTPKMFSIQQMDMKSVRSAILGSQDTDMAVCSSGSTEEDKKRSRSDLTPSSSGSVLSSTASPPGMGGTEVEVTQSLEAMSLTGADQAEGEAGTKKKKKNKKKKNKKKKEDREGADKEEGREDVEMKEPDTTDVHSRKIKKNEDGQKKDKEDGLKASSGSPQKSQQHEKAPSQQGLAAPQQQQQQQQQKFQNQQIHGQHQQRKCHPSAQQQQGQKDRGGARGGQKNKNQGQKKNVFEPYWPKEKVSEGLKKGILIEGQIRINPKNYEDAYVPLPDGTADIYINGMTARNRALNGDMVAVLVQDRDQWRVFKDEVDEYEKVNSPQKCEKVEEPCEVTDNVDEGNDDADVVVEEEEEMELDSSGKPIEGTLVKKAPAPIPATAQRPASGNTGSPGQGARQKDGGKRDGCGSGSGTKNKRFMSVKDLMGQASPVVRKLFDTQGNEGGGGEEEGAVNTNRFIQRTGIVVAIIEQKHSRASSGNLRPPQEKNHSFFTFAPSDSRVPRILIPVNELPAGFKERPGDFTKFLYIARITEWHETSKMPKGTLARSLGEAGQVEPETEALLIENNIDSSDFSKEVLACLPQQSPWTIPAEELSKRRDLRKECIFTIDPATARDLDDALHCTDLGDGVYEVGVHIADVSYFVKENTKLDKVAKSRATSVYLVQKVIPMLPHLLCEQLCSLNPDQDRLSFSVIWKITEKGEILDEWFGRTVIRSCVKLSYDHAQGFIEQPNRRWTVEELPPISKGFTVENIVSRVLQMNKIAKAMRKARFDSGALRLDQVKIQFSLNGESGLPNGYSVYQQRDSNKLVEEFMLLANMAVAHKIRTAHGDKALLRRHPPPQTRMIDDLKEQCNSLGFPIEADSAKDLQRSLARYTGRDELSQARLQVLVVLCSRPMRNAKYFCCGMLKDEQLYHHYALNVPLYTHFTSPIRRYPDILVHRTLAAALDYCDVTDKSPAEINQMAEHCNDMKTNAKQCSERSNELYFAIFVKEAGPLEEKGMVMQVLDKSFDVYMLRLGVVKRVYCEKLPLQSFSHQKERKKLELTLVWKPDNGCTQTMTQKISIFTVVHCTLQSEAEPLKWSASIHRPAVGDPSIMK